MREPTIRGPHGEAWKQDMQIAQKKYPGKKHTTIAAWVIKAPWAHPVWHSYFLAAWHLRIDPEVGAPKIYLSGATHEVYLCALDPKIECVRDDHDCPAKAWLQPANFGAQWVSRSDEEAAAKIERHVKEIVLYGTLSPDTDFLQFWIARFNAAMIKGDPMTAGETKIIVGMGTPEAVEIVIPPRQEKDPSKGTGGN